MVAQTYCSLRTRYAATCVQVVVAQRLMFMSTNATIRDTDIKIFNRVTYRSAVEMFCQYETNDYSSHRAVKHCNALSPFLRPDMSQGHQRYRSVLPLCGYSRKFFTQAFKIVLKRRQKA